jgi:nitrite reductase/ring-hydroxylating ferredoxin subunit
VIVDAGPLEEFREREVTLVRLEGREVGIVRWNGEVYALANVCAHQQGPLCRGTLAARLDAPAPGTMELDEGSPVLACPWHGWEFDVRTGRALWDQQYRVRTYTAHVEEGRVLVELRRSSSSAGA